MMLDLSAFPPCFFDRWWQYSLVFHLAILSILTISQDIFVAQWFWLKLSTRAGLPSEKIKETFSQCFSFIISIFVDVFCFSNEMDGPHILADPQINCQEKERGIGNERELFDQKHIVILKLCLKAVFPKLENLCSRSPSWRRKREYEYWMLTVVMINNDEARKRGELTPPIGLKSPQQRSRLLLCEQYITLTPSHHRYKTRPLLIHLVNHTLQ